MPHHDLRHLRKHAKEIFFAGLKAVDPKLAVHKHVKLIEDQQLQVAGHKYELEDFDRVLVVGCGKAGASMAAALEEILGDKISAGLLNVKYGHVEKLRYIKLNEAGHPVPDKRGVRGAKEIYRLLDQAGERDLILCLLSGGGSALLPLPVDGVSLEETQQLTETLLACGAVIEEVNAVRKHVSKIKGGQLARTAHPATVVTLMLSDVVGDKLDAIASGPTVPDSSTFADVKEILDRYDIWQTVPETIRLHIEKGLKGRAPETPKAGDSFFAKTQHVIVGSNILALQAGAEHAKKLNYNCCILSSFVEGETRDVARVHAAIAREIAKTGNPIEPPACIISGGETTVTLHGSGKGGRNQEFVLAAAMDISGLKSTVILSAGTDGSDGPTDAAGAICDGETLAAAEEKGLQARQYLTNNDSYSFFKELEDLLITGPTNTNVMDLRVILVGD